jgi:hypothetical protein
MDPTRAWQVAGLLGLGAIVACASIDVHKVPSKTQHESWTEEDQRKADKIEGFRYYLPRPYIVVKKEFPWNSKSIVVPGAVSPDGKYILLDPKTLAAANLNSLPDLAFPVSADTLLVTPTAATAPTVVQGQVSTTSGGDAGTGSPSDGGTSEGGSSGGGTKSDAGAEGGTTGASADAGSSSFTIAGSSTSHTVPLSEYMDLLYGPDFDEQYAVEVSGGVSKETFAMQLGNGWMAESINAQIDNSAIGTFIMDQVGKTLDLARSLTSLIPGAGSVLQGSVTSAAVTSAQAQKALVEITTIDYVTPDVYPIYKPRELMECVARSKGSTDSCSALTPGWGEIVHFHTRTRVFLQLVTATSGGGSAPQQSPPGPLAPDAVNQQLVTAAKAQLTTTGITNTVTVVNVLGVPATGQVAVTVHSVDPSKSAAAKAAAIKALPVKVFQTVMQSAKTVTVKLDTDAN